MTAQEKVVLRYLLLRSCSGRPHVILSRSILSRDLKLTMDEVNSALMQLQMSGAIKSGFDYKGHRGGVRVPRGLDCFTPQLHALAQKLVEF